MVRSIFPGLLLTWFAVVSPSLAVQPAVVLAPATTKGFVSVPDLHDLRGRFEQTQLGELTNDPIMQPFMEDLRRQMQGKMSEAGMRIGLTLEDLEAIAGGEVALAIIQPNGDPRAHAQALMVDVTGRGQEVTERLAKVARNMAEKRATRSAAAAAGINLTIYTLPRRQGETATQQVIHFVHQDQLVVADHLDTARTIAARMAGQGDGRTLSTVAAYTESMRRCHDESGEALPQLRWFVEPFGYAQVNRAARGTPRRRGTDLLQVLQNQGFDAIQGAGGWVWFKTDEHEILHRSFAYAPPIQQEDGQPAREGYKLAARMLQFPNQQPLFAQPWIPYELGTYMTFNWKMIDAFRYAETFVDELAGAEGVFSDVLDGIKHDPAGPQVDLVNHLVAHFGERATLISDAKLPITPKSERLLFAIQLTDAAAAQATVDKAMSEDPNANRRMFGDQVIWEIINEDADAVPELRIDGGLGGADADEEKPVLPNSAVTVALGHLLVASHVDFIVDVLKQAANADHLGQAADYQVVDQMLVRLGAGDDSFRVFTRTDEAYRVTYELMRQNRMPEAESLLGRMLNRMFGPDEKGVQREQQIDGAKLPDYQAVRRYLGPAGIYVRSHADGWMATGALLHKDAVR